MQTIITDSDNISNILLKYLLPAEDAQSRH